MSHAHAFARTALPLAAAAGLSLLSSASALAAPAGPVAVVVSSVQPPQVRVVGQGARTTLGSAEFAELRGEYRLSDGGLLVIGGACHRPVAELNDKAPLALLPAGPNQLVSADGKLRLEVRSEANGEVSGLTLHVQPGVR